MKRFIRLLAPALASAWLLCGSVAHCADIRLITEEWPPYNYTSEGRPHGLSVEVIREAMRRLEESAPIEFYPWNRAYRIALEEPGVLIFTMARTREREPLFKWLAPIGRRELHFYKLKHRKDISVGSVADLRRYMTGVNADNDASTRDLVAAGLQKGEHYQVVHSAYDTNLLKLIEGRIDLVAYSPLQLRHDAERNGLSEGLFEAVFRLPADNEEYYFAFSRKTPDAVVERVRKVLLAMRDDGTIDALTAKHGCK